MKRLISFFLLVLTLLPAAGLMAQEHRQRLAILDPVMSDADDGMKLVVREIVSSVFVNNGDKYTILERSLLDKVMQEAKFSNTGAVDEAQATELGKLAGADKIVLTVVSKVGTRCMLSIKLINVETATIEKQHSKVVKYESLLDVIEPLTLAVLGKASEEQLATVDTPEPTAPAAAPAAPAAAPEEPAAPERKRPARRAYIQEEYIEACRCGSLGSTAYGAFGGVHVVQRSRIHHNRALYRRVPSHRPV